LSYGKSRLFPIKEPRNFEEWVTNKFGARLFRIFFKTYTEKVWGMKCSEISADWAAQRIKGLSLASAILHMLLPRRKSPNRGAVIKTLIDSFRYPRRGPGMMWETAGRKILQMGGKINMGEEASSIAYDSSAKAWTVSTRDLAGEARSYRADHVISTMSMKELFASLEPAPSLQSARAAENLRYRDFLVVTLIVRDRNVFDDNWIYIHDPKVKVGRIQNFKSWSPEMVPDPALNCYGLEYFCFEGDSLWTARDEELLALGRSELVKLGLASADDILDGHVVRQIKAYPVYDDQYQERVNTLRAEIDSTYPNLHLVGRNGMHKYNNQDHAMMTAMLTVENIVAGKKLYDVWQVNQDAEYHEAGSAAVERTVAASGRLVPQKVSNGS
jgi:protoporphyrinogen oxidase